MGFSRNTRAYYKWCITRYMRDTYAQAAFKMADICTYDESVHKDNRPSLLAQIEKDVRKLQDVVQEFINLFQSD